MPQAKQRVLTGTRPSGSPHLGNYFGAFRPAIQLQDKYELFFFLADLHALNGPINKDQMTELSLDIVATMLACGLDPKRAVFYAQSTVPQTAELSWMLGCQASYGMMLRAHSFKDAQAKGNDVNMGVFNYPILMAADILLYDATIVPVGQDQKQHLEMTRDMAQRFNNRYGDVLTVPEPLISEAVALVPGRDGQKMSKSKGNVVSIFATDKQWKEQIMGIVTDAKGLNDAKDPDACTVFKLYSLLASKQEAQEMAAKYRAGGYGYGHAKQDLLAKIIAVFGPMRDQYLQLRQRPEHLRAVIQEGSERARLIAEQKMTEIQQAVGLLGGIRPSKRKSPSV